MFLLVTVCFVLRFTGLSLAAFEVSVPQRRVLAVRGRPVVLGCSYAPSLGNSLEDLVVTWQTAGDNLVLHSFYYGQDQLAQQSARYRNRTSMFRPLLGAGNASLRLDRVGPQDSGRYLCSVDSLLGNGKAEVQLEYAGETTSCPRTADSQVQPGRAFYTEPKLNIQVHPSNISLEYQSKGYPAPQVQWTDSAGRNLTAREELSGPGEDGLLSLRTSVTLKDPGPGVNLSFTLRNAALGQVLERPVSLRLASDDIGHCTDCARVTIPLICFLCLLLLCLGLAAFAYLRRKRNRMPMAYCNGSETITSA
ncbi:CD276 antigen-like isoform X1 [Anguilla anguilla]|uniref:CD276 antigen-like isoform X1 n=1 Tax=Anguilla anguilla TaxID=7936 RepID=UPI0015B186A6|nr:CD276 antigen-like isoform X1 [Anguilla anguilla]